MLRPLLPVWARVAAVVAVLLFVLAGELGLHRVALPQNRRLVPTGVIGEGPQQGAFRFGFEMGTGMRTFMPSNLPWVALCAIVLVASVFGALAAGLGFGAGRAWMGLGRHYSRDPDRWDAGWARAERPVRVALGVVMTAAVAVLLRP